MVQSNKIQGYAALGDYTEKSAAYWRNRFADGFKGFPKHRNKYCREVWFEPTQVDSYMRLNLPDWDGPPLSLQMANIIIPFEDAAGLLHEITEDSNAFLRILSEASQNDAKRLFDLACKIVQAGALIATSAGTAMDMTKDLAKGHKFNEAKRKNGLDAAIRTVSEYLEFWNEAIAGQGRVEILLDDNTSTTEVAYQKRALWQKS